jgi:hypothetical protein
MLARALAISRRRLFNVTVVALAAFMAPVAQAQETVTALDTCPASNPERACLLFPFRLAEDAAGLGFQRPEDNDNEEEMKLYVVKGRLVGSKPRQFRLRVFRDSRDTNIGSDNPGALPYRGRSARNRPIILTDRGPLEILTKEFDADFSSNMFIIDGKRWALITAYATAFVPHVRSTSGHIAVWLKTDKACVSAPKRQPGLLTANNIACRRDDGRVAAEGFFQTIGNLDRVARLLPSLDFLRDGALSEDGSIVERDHGYAVAERLPGTSYIVITSGCSDCF